MTITTLIDIGSTLSATGTGNVIGISKEVEILVVGIEREHGSIVGNHFPHGNIATISRRVQISDVEIIDPLVVTRNLYRTILREGHQINITLLLFIAEVLKLPLATLTGEDIGIFCSCLIQADNGILIEDVVNLILA